MSNENTNNSSLPLVIIGLVLLAAIGGGWWLYSNAKKPPSNSNTNTATNKKPNDDAALMQLYNSAPPGAPPTNSLGSANSTVTVEEFADYQCPTCASVHPQIKEINSIYGGRIRFIYRSFPLTQVHKYAYDAALAAEAAGQQGKFWAMQDQLFSNQPAWANSTDARKMFEDYAQKIGLDLNKYQTDLIGLPLKTRVDADMARGQALKLTGTPSIFINGKQLSVDQMNTPKMRQIIEAELQKSSGAAQPNQSANQPAVQPANVTANAK